MSRRPVSFVIAGAAGAATLTAASAPSPLYPVYQRAWDFSSFTLTLVFAVYVGALLAALLMVGSLSDHVGRRTVVSGALVLLASGTLVLATAGGVDALIVGRTLQGFAVGAAAGTLTALISDTAPSPRVGSTVSSAVPSLGIAIGAVLAGAFVEYAPLPRELVFWVLAVAYLVLAGLVWSVPETAPIAAQRHASAWRSLLPSAALPAATRPVFFALLPAICASWALAGLYLSLGSSVIGTVLGVHDHFVVGVFLGVFFVAGIAGTALSSVLPGRLRVPCGYGSLAGGVVLTTVAILGSGAALYVVGSAIAGVGYGATFRHIVHSLSRSTPPEQRGQVFATMYVASYAAFSLPALAAGLGTERFGLSATAVTYGVLVIVLAAIAGVVRPRNSLPGI